MNLMEVKFYNKYKNEFVKIENSVNGDGEIDISGPIGGDSMFDYGYSFEHFKYDLSQIQGDITVNIKSYGGNLFEALAIYDCIRSLKNHVTTKVVGTSASAGTLISLAGDKRLISKNSRYLIHKPMIGAMGNSDDFEKVLESLKDLDKQLIKLYVERTNLEGSEVLELMRKETFISAQEAIDKGFIDGYIKEKKKIENSDEVNKVNKKINNDMDNKILEALNVESEEELFNKIQHLVINKDEADENTADETNETDENGEKIIVSPEDIVDDMDGEVFKQEKKEEEEEEEKMEEEKEEEEKEEEEEENIESLKETIKELEKRLEEYEKDEAEDLANEVNDYVELKIQENVIKEEAKDAWFEVGVEKGFEMLKTLVEAIPKVENKKESLSDFIKGDEDNDTASRKAKVFNEWAEGKITDKEYLERIKNLK